MDSVPEAQRSYNPMHGQGTWVLLSGFLQDSLK